MESGIDPFADMVLPLIFSGIFIIGMVWEWYLETRHKERYTKGLCIDCGKPRQKSHKNKYRCNDCFYPEYFY